MSTNTQISQSEPFFAWGGGLEDEGRAEYHSMSVDPKRDFGKVCRLNMEIDACCVRLTIDGDIGLYTITDATGCNVVHRVYRIELDALLDFCHTSKSHGCIIPTFAAIMLKRALVAAIASDDL